MNGLKYQKGITYIEVLVVFAITSILLGFIYINLFGINPRASTQTSVDSVITDIKHQQIKAMSGDTDGAPAVENFGVYFESNRYTLFRGNSYIASDPRNFVINLEDGLQFSSILIPNSNIIFQRGSGEVAGFTPGSNMVTLTNSLSNQSKTIQFNLYGVVTQVN